MADSSIGRVVGVLTSPEKTFQSIRERPTWLVVLVVIVLIGVGTYTLMSQRMDLAEIVRESIEQSGREMSEEQLENTIDIYEKYGNILSLGGVVLGTPFFYLLGTLGIWVAAKLVGGDFSFKQGWATFVHSQVPHAVAGLLSIPAIFSRDEFHFQDVQTGSILPSNLGFFAPEDASASLLSLLSSVDVFSLWALVLLIIGVGAVGKLSRGTATAAVVSCWLLFVFGKTGFAALTG